MNDNATKRMRVVVCVNRVRKGCRAAKGKASVAPAASARKKKGRADRNPKTKSKGKFSKVSGVDEDARAVGEAKKKAKAAGSDMVAIRNTFILAGTTATVPTWRVHARTR